MLAAPPAKGEPRGVHAGSDHRSRSGLWSPVTESPSGRTETFPTVC